MIIKESEVVHNDGTGMFDVVDEDGKVIDSFVEEEDAEDFVRQVPEKVKTVDNSKFPVKSSTSLGVIKKKYPNFSGEAYVLVSEYGGYATRSGIVKGFNSPDVLLFNNPDQARIARHWRNSQYGISRVTVNRGRVVEIHPLGESKSMRIVEEVSRKPEYDQYLKDHIANVKRSWNEILYPRVLDLLTDTEITVEEFTLTTVAIDKHDSSKYSTEEYDAYLEYYYPSDGSERDFDNVPEDVNLKFDIAWLHHQKHNPHHWQYWCLIRDSGEFVPVDMPIEAVLEMLCDWHSFSAKDPESTAYQWYQDNGDKMVLSDNTRKLVEKLVVLMKDPLD